MSELENIAIDQPQTDFEKLVTMAFSRCTNWPKEPDGISGLVQGLQRACQETGIEPVALVNRCAELSHFCPTDKDLLKVAREMRAAARAEIERTKPPAWAREKVCEKCDGTGFEMVIRQCGDFAIPCSNGCQVPNRSTSHRPPKGAPRIATVKSEPKKFTQEDIQAALEEIHRSPA